MPVPSVVGFSSSTKLPQFSFALVLGGPGTSGGAAPKKALIIAPYIATAITGSVPSFTCPAGTATANVPVQVFSTADAIAFAGQGSECHRMAKRFFAQYPTGTLYIVPVVAANAGAQAAATITMTGSATASGILQCYVYGELVEIAVATTDSLTSIASHLATAINNNADLPVTAQNSAGVVTVTAKHKGNRGALINLRVRLVSGTTYVEALTGSLAATLFGLTATLSSGKLTGATGDDDISTALTNIAPTEYDKIILAQEESTNINRARDAIVTNGDVNHQLDEQVVAGSVDTLANMTTLTTAVNSSFVQVAWHYDADAAPGEIAAQVAAGRLIGDGAAGGNLVGEATDPAANLNGLLLATITRQYLVASRPTNAQLDQALNNGGSPLAPAVARPPYTVLVSSYTTRFLDANSLPNYAVSKTKVVTVSQYLRKLLRSDLATQFAGFKLRNDDPSGAPVKIPRVTTPNTVRQRIYTNLKLLEEQGILESVDDACGARLANLVVARDPANPNRLLCDVPEIPIADLDQVVGNIRQLSPIVTG